MCRTKDAGGIALAIVTLGLILYGWYCGNRFCVWYWYWQEHLDQQAIQGIPLTFRGLMHCVLFNTFCFGAIASHLRGAFADPGKMPEGMEAPFQSEYMEIKNCMKCKGEATWKPIRAHHCQECGFCIFKMDHHCPWINNCVGQRNYKYFIQFVLYICLSSFYLALLMFLAFYNLLTCERTKTHMNKPGYPLAFIMCIVAFVEGILFTFFTYEILTEQFESIDENKSYIDGLKKQYGRQGELFENAASYFGNDYMWWIMPTHPEIHINYLERCWTKKQVQQMIRTGQFDTAQEHSDPDKKGFSVEQRWAAKEKKAIWLLIVICLLAWFFGVQEWMASSYSNKPPPPPQEDDDWYHD